MFLILRIRVIHRIGGLEKYTIGAIRSIMVIRRIGGLEILHAIIKSKGYVIRRIGGLEIICFGSSVGRTGGTTLESAVQFRPEAAR